MTNLTSKMKKILVIEDHAMMRRNVLVILEMEGYRVASASNGREGLALAISEHPDLILCDVMMPELDGHAVLTALRTDPQTANIPFIFLTAKGEKSDQRAGMNLGADDYLTKPITRNDLVAALDARFARKEQQRVNFERLFINSTPLQALGITAREAEVLLWIVQGKGNDEIGGILGVSPQTVKKHVCAILDTLGVDNRSSASIRAMEVLVSGKK
jgi:DNA-binding NarL/FixJ family response regulator